jgi:hypothetical protein
MTKIKPLLILVQWLGIFFLINGFLRLFYSFKGAEIEYLKTAKEEFHSPEYLTIVSDFLSYSAYMAVGAYLLGIVLIALINWKRKNHFLNTIVVVVLGFAVLPLGILFGGVISKTFNHFGGLFTNHYTYSFLIGGLTFSIIGGLLIWKSSSIGKGSRVV